MANKLEGMTEGPYLLKKHGEAIFITVNGVQQVLKSFEELIKSADALEFIFEPNTPPEEDNVEVRYMAKKVPRNTAIFSEEPKLGAP